MTRVLSALRGLVLLSLGAATAVAQEPAPSADEVLDSYRRNQLITARRLADALLDADPDAIVGHYVLGCVLRESDGNLPKAMHHLGRARELFEARYPSPSRSDRWQLHVELLDTIQRVAGETDAYAYQLQILDYHDALYDPDKVGERGWPLMKLGRLDEARQWSERATRSSDTWQQTLGFNTLCALESEAGRRGEAHAACLAALEHSSSIGEDDTVDAYNAALSALGVLRFADAEALALQANRGVGLSTANPWRTLLELYLGQGRGAAAVSAVEDMQRWRARLPPHLRDQDRAETDVGFATLLLVAGETRKGMEVVTRAIEYPDRRGLTSSSPAQALGGHALVRIAMRRTHQQRLQERAATWGVAGRLQHAGGSLLPDPVDWADRATVANVLASGDLLRSTLRVYLAGGLSDVPSWLHGDLVDVLGPGVVAAALRQVRLEEDLPGVLPYLDGLEAEAWLARGGYGSARALAEQALVGLPREEVLVRARVRAVAAQAAWRGGDRDTALAHYEAVLRDDPGALRRLGFALPATVSVVGGDTAATQAGRMLRRSPRVEAAPGFQITVDGTGDALRLCLLSPQGSRLSCSDTARPVSDDGVVASTWDHAGLAVDAFHRRAFAIPLGLSAIDLSSLDGTTTVASEAAREKMEALLRSLSD